LLLNGRPVRSIVLPAKKFSNRAPGSIACAVTVYSPLIGPISSCGPSVPVTVMGAPATPAKDGMMILPRPSRLPLTFSASGTELIVKLIWLLLVRSPATVKT